MHTEQKMSYTYRAENELCIQIRKRVIHTDQETSYTYRIQTIGSHHHIEKS